MLEVKTPFIYKVASHHQFKSRLECFRQITGSNDLYYKEINGIEDHGYKAVFLLPGEEEEADRMIKES